MKETLTTNASSYCNYNDTFTKYDQLRQPNGLRELLHILEMTKLPIDQQAVLEGGFGTGAYIDRIRHHVKEVHGVEGSDEGLEQALRKMSAATNVFLQVGNILNLPFPDHRFHAYVVNQVLHHIDSSPDYPNIDAFLRESRRVLKPGGVLTINTCFQEQLDADDGVYWNYKYLGSPVRAMQARYIPVDELIARMEELAFTDIETTLPSGHIFHEQYYTDPHFVLEPEFQKSDSVHSLMSSEGIARANARICSGIADGSVYAEMKRAAGRAAELGEAVIISARTPVARPQ